jgi:hypothetical protein
MATVTLEYLGKQPRGANQGFVETRTVTTFEWNAGNDWQDDLDSVTDADLIEDLLAEGDFEDVTA